MARFHPCSRERDEGEPNPPARPLRRRFLRTDIVPPTCGSDLHQAHASVRDYPAVTVTRPPKYATRLPEPARVSLAAGPTPLPLSPVHHHPATRLGSSPAQVPRRIAIAPQRPSVLCARLVFFFLGRLAPPLSAAVRTGQSERRLWIVYYVGTEVSNPNPRPSICPQDWIAIF